MSETIQRPQSAKPKHLGYCSSFEPCGNCAAVPEKERAAAIIEGPQSEEGRLLDRLWDENKARADAAREPEARERGGYLYTVPLGQRPIAIAQHYGGKRPGVLLELLAVNPSMEAGPCGVCLVCQAKDGRECPQPRARWARWFVGQGVLIPFSWGDPRGKGDPPAVPQNPMARRINASADAAKRAKASKA